MEKLTDKMFKNTLAIINLYCPTLIEIIGEREFRKWLGKGFFHTNQYPTPGTPNMNFTATFFKLIEAIKGNGEFIVIEEFKYFNHLLGKFMSLQPNNRAFKNLVLGAMNNFKSDANFLEVLSEVGICLSFAEGFKFEEYEHQLSNGKSIDFRFASAAEQDLLVEVQSIHFDANRYENPDTFKKYMNIKLKDKFDTKTEGLETGYKDSIFIAPIMYGITNEIVKECYQVFKGLSNEKKFNSYEPRFFGNIQGTYFDLFTVDEVNNFPSPGN